jgi:hypothetical protein
MYLASIHKRANAPFAALYRPARPDELPGTHHQPARPATGAWPPNRPAASARCSF